MPRGHIISFWIVDLFGVGRRRLLSIGLAGGAKMSPVSSPPVCSLACRLSHSLVEGTFETTDHSQFLMYFKQCASQVWSEAERSGAERR